MANRKDEIKGKNKAAAKPKGKAAKKAAVKPKAKTTAKAAAGGTATKKVSAAAAQFPAYAALGQGAPVHSTGMMPKELIDLPVLERPCDNPALATIAASMKTTGQMEPALVVPVSSVHPQEPPEGWKPYGGKRFRLVGGMTRFKCCPAGKLLVTIIPPFASSAEESLKIAELNENRGAWGDGKTMSDVVARAVVIGQIIDRFAADAPDMKKGDVDAKLVSAGFTGSDVKHSRFLVGNLLGNGWARTNPLLTWRNIGEFRSYMTDLRAYMSALVSYFHGEKDAKTKNQRFGYDVVSQGVFALVGLASATLDTPGSHEDDAPKDWLGNAVFDVLQAALSLVRDNAHPDWYGLVGKEVRPDVYTAKVLEQHFSEQRGSVDMGTTWGDLTKDEKAANSFRAVIHMLLLICQQAEKCEEGACKYFLEVKAPGWRFSVATAMLHEDRARLMGKTTLDEVVHHRKLAEQKKKDAAAKKAAKKPGAAKPRAASSGAVASSGGGAAKSAPAAAEPDEETSISLKPIVRTEIHAIDRQGNAAGLPEWKASGKVEDGYPKDASAEEVALAEVCEFLAMIGGAADVQKVMDFYPGTRPPCKALPASADLAKTLLRGLAIAPCEDITDDRNSAPDFSRLLGIWRTAKGKEVITSALAFYGIDLAHLRTFRAAFSLEAEMMKGAVDSDDANWEFLCNLSATHRMRIGADFGTPVQVEENDGVTAAHIETPMVLSLWRVPGGTADVPVLHFRYYGSNHFGDEFHPDGRLANSEKVATPVGAGTFSLMKNDAALAGAKSFYPGEKQETWDAMSGVQLRSLWLSGLLYSSLAGAWVQGREYYGLGGESQGAIRRGLKSAQPDFCSVGGPGRTGGVAYEFEQLLARAHEWPVSGAFQFDAKKPEAK